MGPRGSPHVLVVPCSAFFVDLFNIWAWLRAGSSRSLGQCQLSSVTREREQCPHGKDLVCLDWLSLGKLQFFQEYSMSQCQGLGVSQSRSCGCGGRSLLGLLWIHSTSLAPCSDRHHGCFCWNGKQKEIILQTFPRP